MPPRPLPAPSQAPGRNAAARIAAIGALLDGLRLDEQEVTTRRLLALTRAYEAALTGDRTQTLEAFFASVDDFERNLNH